MIAISPNTRMLFFNQPTDMRKSFDGLAGLVRNELQDDPTDGTLFLFVNKKRDRIKMLDWDRDGLALWYKRLEAGTFEAFNIEAQTKAIEIDITQLNMLLSGIEIESAKRRKRYARAA